MNNSTVGVKSRDNIYTCAVIALILVASILSIFHKPLTSHAPLDAPDAPISHLKHDGEDFPANGAGGWRNSNLGELVPPYNLLPRRFLQKILPTQDYLTLAYAADMLLLAISTLIMLRAMNLSFATSLTCAIALSLSCHTTSLVSAGHMSKNGMMPFAVLTIACLHLGITRNSILWFLLCGICAGTALCEHYDVAYLFCILACAYGLFLIWIHRKTLLHAGRSRLKLAAGIILAGLLCLTTFLPALTYITGRLAPGRDEVVKTEGRTDPQAKWIFATNWSLPPEEILEFIYPGIFGFETGRESRPYWGRTGRDITFDKSRTGLRNLRQHGVYMGVIPILLAVLAIIRLIRRRQMKHPVPDALSTIQSKIVAFWATATPVLVILSLGRFAPPYRAFYSLLPYADSMRCPIKWLHTVEVAIVILAAFGLETVYQTVKQRSAAKTDGRSVLRTLLIASAILCGLSIILAIAAALATPQITAYLNSTGFSEKAARLILGIFLSLGRTTLLTALFSALIFTARTKMAARRLFPAAFAISISLLMAADLVAANLPYVRTNKSAAFLYSGNDLIRRLQQHTNMNQRVVAPVQDPLSASLPEMLRYFEVPFFEPPRESYIDSDVKAFYSALNQNFLRLWQLTSCGFVFGPGQQLAPLLNTDGFAPVAYYAMVAHPSRTVALVEAPRDRSQFLLASYTNALPRAALFYGWECLNRNAVNARLSSASWNPLSTALVECNDKNSSVAVGFEAVSTESNTPSHVCLRITARHPALLLLNDRFDPCWTATVDGTPATVYRVNGLMRGVFLEQGSHEVLFSLSRPYKAQNQVRLAFMAFALLTVMGAAAVPLFTPAKQAE